MSDAFGRAGRALALGLALSIVACSDGAGPEEDNTPPAVVVTSPEAGVVSGMVTIAVAATDDRGIKGVDFYMNGGLLGPRDVTPPYEFLWNADAAGVGTFTIWAVAFDTSNNGATSAEVTVTTQ
jgi:hypothetical protein